MQKTFNYIDKMYRAHQVPGEDSFVEGVMIKEKGTDFSKVKRADVLAVENIVNSIHRRSLTGETANEYHSSMAKAA